MKFFAALLLLPLALCGAELVKVVPEDVLFLAHFDHSVKPEKGNSANAECLARLSSNNSGFPFGKGKQEALDLSRMGKLYYLDAQGNFSADSGTLQFWVLPKWNVAKYAHCVFFWLLRDPDKKNYFNWKELFIQKKPKSKVLSAGANQKTFATGEIESCGVDSWMQLAVTWNKKANKVKFYINGKLAGSGALGKRFTMPEKIVFGGPRTWNAQAFIDEVRILKRVLTDDEIKQDFEAQKEGKPFELSGNGKAQATGYKVVKSSDTAASAAAGSNSAIDVKNVKFSAAYVPADFKVDGNLDKAVWKNAPAAPEFITRHGGKMRNKSVVKMVYSPNALYISARCFQDMSKLTARWDQDDQAVWNDDDVEVFIDVPGERGGFHQIGFNALGSIADLRNGDSKWNAARRQIKVKRFKDRWDLEFKIPFSSLGMNRPFPGDVVGIRFYRAVRNGTGGFDGGSIPFVNGGNNRRHRLAALTFAGGSGAELAVETSAKGFLPGVNNFKVTVKNNGKTGYSGTIKAVLQDRQGNLSTLEEKSSVSIAPGKSGSFDFSVTVPHMDAAKVAIIASTAQSEAAAVVINPAYPMTAGGFIRQIAQVKRERGVLALLLESRHPAFENAVVAMNDISKILSDYERAFAAAVKNKTVVSKDVAVKTVEHLNGFSAYAAKNPYLLWQSSPWAIGAPDELPPVDFDAEKVQKFNLSLAGNEREALCFTVSGLFCNGRMDLRVVPQVKRTKAGISTRNFEIFIERFINHSGDVISGPLVPVTDGMITVTPGAAVRVWVIFNSRGVDPGTYKANILLKGAYDHSIVTRKIPLDVKVWNFKLPETHEWPLQSFMWGPNYNIYDEIAALELTHAYHITHGWSKSFNYTHGFGRDGYRNKLPAGKLFDEQVTRTANEEFLKAVLRLKMKFVIGWNLPKAPEFYRIMGKRLKDMGFEDGQFVFKALIRDEFVKAHIPQWQKERDEVAKFKGNWHFQAVYLSAPPPTGATMDDIERARMPEFYKMWTVIRGLLKDGKRGQEVIRRLRAKGCQVWSYSCGRYMQTLSVLDYYRLYAWECYLNGLDGMAFWTAMSVKDDPFDHRDGYDDGVMLAWHGGKPIPTKRLQAIREGLEDVAYIAQLKKELARCKAKGLNFPEYEKLLAECNDIRKAPTQEKVDSWRDRCGAAIDVLSRK